MKKSAIISSCKQYRYELRRIWDENKPLVLFVCLNPSTADETLEDRTSQRCINYAKSWGYGGLIMGNLFAYRATDRNELYKVSDPIGCENDASLKRLQLEAKLIICAWGDTGGFNNRDKQVLGFLNTPHCLNQLISGRPRHPLYSRADLQPSLLKIRK